MKYLPLSLILALYLPAYANSGPEIFITQGEHGETEFSDMQADEHGRNLPLSYKQPTLSSSQQVEQMLVVANALAQARREREQQRKEVRQRYLAHKRQLAAAAPPEQHQTHWGYPLQKRHHFDRPNRHPNKQRPNQKPPSATPPSRTFRFNPEY